MVSSNGIAAAVASTIALLTCLSGCTEKASSNAFVLGHLKHGMTLGDAEASGEVANCRTQAVMTSTDPHDFNRLSLQGDLTRNDPNKQICGLTASEFAGVDLRDGSAFFTGEHLTSILIKIDEGSYDRAKDALREQFGAPCDRDTRRQSNTIRGTIREADPYTVGGYGDRPTSSRLERLSDSATWCFDEGRLVGRRFTHDLGASSFIFSPGA